MQRSQDRTPQAVDACHELLLWMIPQVEKFPRARRFTLGERIEVHLIEVLERLVEAAYSRRKSELLARANTKLDVVRHLWRMGYALKHVSGKSYAHGSRLLDDLGRQIGGWRRADANRDSRVTRDSK